MHRGTQTLLTATAALCFCAALSASPRPDAGAASKPSTTLTILVTNDDGVTAPGINATVQALSAPSAYQGHGGRTPYQSEWHRRRR